MIRQMDYSVALSKYGRTGRKVSSFLNEKITPPRQIIPGLLDERGKMMIVGSSKSFKTFFVMQLGLRMASGTNWLGLDLPKSKVCYCNLEVTDAHAMIRVQNICHKLHLDDHQVDGFTLQNLRGKAFDVFDPLFSDYIAAEEFDAIIFDPFYKVMVDGDENSAQDVKPYLARFDEIGENAGAAIIYVHHCAKGTPGDRNAIDRGAGSGVIGRDVDADIMLLPHTEDGLLVAEFINRAYPKKEPFTIRFIDGCFVVDETPAEIKTSGSRTAAAQPDISSAWSWFCKYNKPIKTKKAVEILRESLGYSRRGAESAIKDLVTLQKLTQYKGGWPYAVWIGIPGVMMGMAERVKTDEFKEKPL
jgi:hypothetical protein